MPHELDLKIRDYIESDYEEVNSIWDELGMGGVERGDNPQIIEETLKRGGRLIILYDTATQKIIGTSWATNDGRRILLHHFGIKKEYQGRGYSKILLKETLDFAKRCGLQIKLEVHRENETAINLYRKYGFKYLGDYDLYIIRK